MLASAAIGSLLGGLVSARVAKRIGALAALLTALATNVLIFVGIGLARTRSRSAPFYPSTASSPHSRTS